VQWGSIGSHNLISAIGRGSVESKAGFAVAARFRRSALPQPGHERSIRFQIGSIGAVGATPELADGLWPDPFTPYFCALAVQSAQPLLCTESTMNAQKPRHSSCIGPPGGRVEMEAGNLFASVLASVIIKTLTPDRSWRCWT
jgi:hypothetical protein